ncbi:MAG TPA: Crp/Fnr family transcriptional regulator [Candidatus Saccharimonadales bacterium]|nr:Crp/Fnr family transcriptional regulator [Candidatus Saccharimonadales bacterium]
MSDQIALNYLHVFLERHPVRTFKKREMIVFQGEAPRQAYVVKNGTVKAYNLSVSGDEKPVAFYQTDSVFPATWVYGQESSATYYYEAFTPQVEIYCIDRPVFVNFIKNRPELLYHELHRILADQLGASIRLNALQHSRASDKLIYTLHYLALSHGKSSGNGKIELTLDVTHQDLANLTGLTRETAATELNKLKKQGIIKYGKHTPYQLNLARLTRLLNDEFIADLANTSVSSAA